MSTLVSGRWIFFFIGPDPTESSSFPSYHSVFFCRFPLSVRLRSTRPGLLNPFFPAEQVTRSLGPLPLSSSTSGLAKNSWTAFLFQASNALSPCSFFRFASVRSIVLRMKSRSCFAAELCRARSRLRARVLSSHQFSPVRSPCNKYEPSRQFRTRKSFTRSGSLNKFRPSAFLSLPQIDSEPAFVALEYLSFLYFPLLSSDPLPFCLFVEPTPLGPPSFPV